MKRIRMLESISPDLILSTLLTSEQVDAVQKDVKIFLKEQHNLPQGVLNAVIIKSILTTGDQLFNQVYLRKVTETFKEEGIITVSLAVNKLEKDYTQAKQRKRNNIQAVPEPSWMPEIIESFKMKN